MLDQNKKPISIEKEVQRLRRDVDRLKEKARHGKREVYEHSYAKHIEDLDRDIKRQQNQPKQKAAPIEAKPKANILVRGSAVQTTKSGFDTKPGQVLYIACRLALPSVKKCDKKNCAHPDKPFVWVYWPNQQKTFAHHFTDLKLLTEEDLKPKIGKELSGKIGPWTYTVETKTWQKDGDSKVYSQEEFADALYWETHPFDKDDGNEFVRELMRDKKAPEKAE